jgi:membrane-associated phospholipid phosphatase
MYLASVSTVTTADDGLYRSITGFAQHTRWLNGLMSLLTVALIAALAVLLVYAAWRAWRAGDRAALAAAVWAGAGTVLSIGCGLVLKQVFQETRPCLAMPDVTTVQTCPGPTDYAFPSDHTTVAVALAAGLWLINRRLGAIGAVLALIEGFSRIYLGMHYPHDVLAGIVLSCVVVLGGWLLVRRPLIRLSDRLPAGLLPDPVPERARDEADVASSAR